MPDSILTNTKKVLGIDSGYTAFDVDIIIHINSVFSTLHQLGIGPVNGFAIEDATATWDAFIGPNNLPLNVVKSYMYLRLRLLFDPPTTSYLIDSLKKQSEEMEWRMNIQREGVSWTPPTPPLCPPEV